MFDSLWIATEFAHYAHIFLVVATAQCQCKDSSGVRALRSPKEILLVLLTRYSYEVMVKAELH